MNLTFSWVLFGFTGNICSRGVCVDYFPVADWLRWGHLTWYWTLIGCQARSGWEPRQGPRSWVEKLRLWQDYHTHFHHTFPAATPGHHCVLQVPTCTWSSTCTNLVHVKSASLYALQVPGYKWSSTCANPSTRLAWSPLFSIPWQRWGSFIEHVDKAGWKQASPIRIWFKHTLHPVVILCLFSHDDDNVSLLECKLIFIVCLTIVECTTSAVSVVFIALKLEKSCKKLHHNYMHSLKEVHQRKQKINALCLCNDTYNFIQPKMYFETIKLWHLPVLYGCCWRPHLRSCFPLSCWQSHLTMTQDSLCSDHWSSSTLVTVPHGNFSALVEPCPWERSPVFHLQQKNI